MTRTEATVTATSRERPILFSGPMVRAILAGKKTQTRRVIKRQPASPATIFDPDKLSDGSSMGVAVGPVWCIWPSNEPKGDGKHDDHGVQCPFGRPGDRLWVRETWQEDPCGEWGVCYRATGHSAQCAWRDHLWRPSIFMPRRNCRLILEVTEVRVERLQEISEGDALAEGITECHMTPVESYRKLWNSINADRGYGWEANPWVWVYEFRRIEA